MSGPSETDFDAWNEEKKAIHIAARLPPFREREVWWCAIGVNVGSEVYGKGRQRTRPVIVMRRLNREAAIVVPVTSQQPAYLGDWYHPMHWSGRAQWAMLHQTRMVSAARFTSRMVTLPMNDLHALKAAYRAFIGT